MKTLQEIQAFSTELRFVELLDRFVHEVFPGRMIVSASLRARSIVALQLVAEADPTIPVVFCHAGPLYPESEEYRDYIVDRFGLTDVRTLHDDESSFNRGAEDHIEWIMASTGGEGAVKQALYLNRTLADFDCWLSSVYHMPADKYVRHRTDKEGHVLRVDPLLRWSTEDIHRFMRAREIPYHKLAKRKLPSRTLPDDFEPVVTHAY